MISAICLQISGRNGRGGDDGSIRGILTALAPWQLDRDVQEILQRGGGFLAGAALQIGCELGSENPADEGLLSLACIGLVLQSRSPL